MDLRMKENLKTKEGYPVRKYAYGEKLIQFLEKSQKILVIGADHIGSRKMSQLRKEYRGRARFLFGKNTLIRRMLRKYVRDTHRLEVSSLMPVLRGNCCLVFMKGNPSIFEMIAFEKEVVMKSRVTCAPRAGDIAPCDVILRPMDTGLEPTRTSFFAAMNIATRINRGQIQIVERVCLVRAGERVGASEAALLHTLGMKPFSYALEPIAVYDEGECYLVGSGGPLGRERVPNLLTVPGSVRSAYETMVALGLESLKQYWWEQLDNVSRCLEAIECVGQEDGEEETLNYDSGGEEPAPSPEPAWNPFDFSDDSDDSDEG